MTTDWNPDDPDATRVVYDLSSWTFDQQAELAAELAEAEIPHAWDGTDLMVPEDFEEQADVVIDQVEDRLGIQYAEDGGGDGTPADLPPVPLPDGVASTEYELTEWAQSEREAVTRVLTMRRLPFRWEGDGVLLVRTDDEQVVESLLDMIENGEIGAEAALEEMDEEWTEADRLPFESLTVFFLAGERLRKDPLDADGLEQLLEAVDMADPAHPPFGVDIRLWERACALAEQLADALGEDEIPDEQTAVETAEQLHDLLRPYI